MVEDFVGTLGLEGQMQSRKGSLKQEKWKSEQAWGPRQEGRGEAEAGGSLRI